MKRSIFYIFFVVTPLLYFTACRVQQTPEQKEAMAAEIRQAVESSRFHFEARRALPSGFRSVNLTSFSVQVSPDTVKVNLPFFGRAFRAPIHSTQGPYNFTSTNFEYNATPGHRAGSWLVDIRFRDLDREVIFSFDIWENGNGGLSIRDTDRQSISFQGEVLVGR